MPVRQRWPAGAQGAAGGGGTRGCGAAAKLKGAPPHGGGGLLCKAACLLVGPRRPRLWQRQAVEAVAPLLLLQPSGSVVALRLSRRLSWQPGSGLWRKGCCALHLHLLAGRLLRHCYRRLHRHRLAALLLGCCRCCVHCQARAIRCPGR